MAYIVRYKTGETDDLFWSLDDTTAYLFIKKPLNVDSIVKINNDDLHFSLCEKNIIYYVYSSKNRKIKGVFLSENDAFNYTNVNNMRGENDFYIKRLITPYRRAKNNK